YSEVARGNRSGYIGTGPQHRLGPASLAWRPAIRGPARRAEDQVLADLGSNLPRPGGPVFFGCMAAFPAPGTAKARNDAGMLTRSYNATPSAYARETGGFTPFVPTGGASNPAICGTTSGTSAPAPTPTEGGSRCASHAATSAVPPAC